MPRKKKAKVEMEKKDSDKKVKGKVEKLVENKVAESNNKIM
jgi:hypothetical protein